MIIQGILLGISLSFMIGPLFFSIIEAGIAQGFRAGIAVAMGIWFSDVLYVAVVVSSVDLLASMTALPGFKIWAGIIGGCLLVAFGLGSFLTAGRQQKPGVVDAGKSPKGYRWQTYWLRGFLLNTINPFTVFFWLSVAGAVIIPNGWNAWEAIYFFGGMLGTLVISDTLKAYGARQIRRFLTPKHTFWVQKGIGITLLVFGIVLVVRVL
ncbi:MAG: LysE family transporter [Saprospiraceae bacterium]|nr:LysE family transporter [Saprospiraceae bacterium]